MGHSVRTVERRCLEMMLTETSERTKWQSPHRPSHSLRGNSALTKKIPARPLWDGGEGDLCDIHVKTFFGSSAFPYVTSVLKQKVATAIQSTSLHYSHPAKELIRLKQQLFEVSNLKRADIQLNQIEGDLKRELWSSISQNFLFSFQVLHIGRLLHWTSPSPLELKKQL